MTHLFIVNPAAGSSDRSAILCEQIDDLCKRHGLTYRVEISRAPGHCRELARQAAESGEEYRIYACGGDGTLSEVASGAAGYPNVAVTCWKNGSGNDFIKLFSEPEAFSDPERLMDCEEAVFDMVRCNDDLCMNICSVGLDARIGLDVSKFKRLPLLSGYRAYVLSTVLHVIRGIGEHYVVKIEGETVDARQTMICVCNGQWYGGGFHPVPDASPTDGMLDVLLVKEVFRLQVPMVVGKYKNGRYQELPHLVRHIRTKELEILCDKPTPFNLDGESRIAQEVKISIAREKLRFFYPRGLTYK